MHRRFVVEVIGAGFVFTIGLILKEIQLLGETGLTM
jgi:hypothetical protein